MVIHSIAIKCVGLVDSSNLHCGGSEQHKEVLLGQKGCVFDDIAPTKILHQIESENKVHTTKHIKIYTSGAWGDITSLRVYNLQ